MISTSFEQLHEDNCQIRNSEHCSTVHSVPSNLPEPTDSGFIAIIASFILYCHITISSSGSYPALALPAPFSWNQKSHLIIWICGLNAYFLSVSALQMSRNIYNYRIGEYMLECWEDRLKGLNEILVRKQKCRLLKDWISFLKDYTWYELKNKTVGV